MKTRPLGKTGMEVSELALGTWGLSGDGYGPVDEREQDAVIRRAQALGIRLFETAGSYAAGSMEKRLGALLSPTEGCRVVTKLGTDLEAVPARKDFSRAFLRRSCAQSAERLRRGQLDVVLLHNPAATTVAKGEACDTLKELQREGAVRNWGVSAGSVEVAKAALLQGAEVLQLVYHPFLRRDLEGLALQPGDCGVLIRSVLAHGLLAGQWPQSKTFSRGDHRSERWTPDQFQARLSQLSALTCALDGEVQTPRAVALRFALASPVASSVVLGPRNTTQLDQLVRDAGRGPTYLSGTSQERLRAELLSYGVRQ